MKAMSSLHCPVHRCSNLQRLLSSALKVSRTHSSHSNLYSFRIPRLQWPQCWLAPVPSWKVRESRPCSPKWTVLRGPCRLAWHFLEPSSPSQAILQGYWHPRPHTKHEWSSEPHGAQSVEKDISPWVFRSSIKRTGAHCPEIYNSFS